MYLWIVSVVGSLTSNSNNNKKNVNHKKVVIYFNVVVAVVNYLTRSLFVSVHEKNSIHVRFNFFFAVQIFQRKSRREKKRFSKIAKEYYKEVL